MVGLAILDYGPNGWTFASVPAGSFKGDCNYPRCTPDAILGRLLIVVVLSSAFHAARMTMRYEYHRPSGSGSG